jgi:hypothetical protein
VTGLIDFCATTTFQNKNQMRSFRQKKSDQKLDRVGTRLLITFFWKKTPQQKDIFA